MKDQFKPILILFYVTVAATLWKYLTIPLNDFGAGWTNSFLIGTHKQVFAFLLFGLIPMGIVKFVFKEKLSDYGVRIGIASYTVRSALIMFPIIVLLAVMTGYNPAFFDVYPFNAAIRPQNARIGYEIFMVNAVLYLGYYWGWEFLFRGFIQHGLSERCGIQTAILIQTLASTMLHYGHPPSEVAASILAGIFWGFLAVRTKSILSGFLQHALLGIVLDWTLIYTR